MMAELRIGTPKGRVRNEPAGESHVQDQEATEKPEGNSRLPKRKERMPWQQDVSVVAYTER